MLSWRLSNTHDARFCTDPLTEALERYTDQGNQFPSLESTATLKDAGVAISMGGRGRCMDNIFIERASRTRLCPKPSNCKNSQMASKPNGSSPDGYRFTIPNGFTPSWPTPPRPNPTTKECRWRGRLSRTPCLPLCRLNQNTKS